MSSCSLCDKLVNLEQLPPEENVWQFSHSVAFLGPWQFYTGYCVLVSRTHTRELTHLPDLERQGFLEEMCRLAAAIERAFQPHKMNLELLGNQVAHPHWHLFPRSTTDPDHLKPVWVALDRAERDPAEKHRLQTAPISRLEINAKIRRELEG